MAKGKGSLSHEPANEAYQRVNFLYQASIALMEDSSHSALPAFYGHLAKQITKKIVGRIHPDIKRTLCKACSNPLEDVPNGGSIRVVPFKNKGKRSRRHKGLPKNEAEIVKTENEKQGNPNCTTPDASRSTSRFSVTDEATEKITEKKSRPNRLKITCHRCGYVRSLLQRPGYKLWIDLEEAAKS